MGICLTFGLLAVPLAEPVAAAAGDVEVVKTEKFRGRRATDASGSWIFTLSGSGGFTSTQCTNGSWDGDSCEPGVEDHILLWSGLGPGDYMLCEEPFANWVTKFKNRPDGAVVSGRCMTFTLGSGEELSQANGTEIRVRNVCRGGSSDGAQGSSRRRRRR